MTNQELQNKITEYKKLADNIDELTKAKKQLSSEILTELESTGEMVVTTPEGIKATVVEKTTIKYLDETAIIKYLRDNNIEGTYETKIVTTKLNSKLKDNKNLTLQESLKPYYSQTTARELKVTK